MEPYRPWLARSWDDTKPPTIFVMLNPSTADETVDDPTIRKCIGFAERWGSGALIVVNLYDLRATNPDDLINTQKASRNSDENDQSITLAFDIAVKHDSLVVCAWGANVDKLDDAPERVAYVQALAAARGIELLCLKVTKDNHPGHPLYVPYETVLQSWPS